MGSFGGGVDDDFGALTIPKLLSATGVPNFYVSKTKIQTAGGTGTIKITGYTPIAHLKLEYSDDDGTT